ncbi:hypothetical protein A3K73_02795 [Candidatus Pacearchaeota archaeon RBG_13_36_9]|nr:MAG: hypothetical protein A3K73_02795 [Candidatus Pacearchaeota archaeon RBG_13_36_9]
MKEFNDFLIEGVAKKQYPDKQRARDLIDGSEKKFKNLIRTIEKIGIDAQNSEDIIEDCHNIILGIIRARMLLSGFSASGQGAHEAEVAYLGELDFSEQEIEFVNQLRYFRNGILYYGKKFDKEYAKKVFSFLEKFKEKIKAFVIIIRGPLGIGKTTIAKMLAKDFDAEYFSIDSVLEQEGLDKIDEKQGCIPAGNFIKANHRIIPKIRESISLCKPIIVDGNFYHKEQLENLIKKLDEAKSFVFTLKASLKTCIERDKKRQKPYGKQAAEAVYKLVSKFDYGIAVDTENKTEEEVVEEIKKRGR